MKRLLWVAVCCVLLASCSDDVVGPSGEIVGFGGLRDEAGVRLRDQSGITVQLKGTSYSATSDTSGKWTLSDVPAGIYDVELSKAGYATNYVRAFQFVGGGTAYITSVIDLIRSRRDTMSLQRSGFAPEYEYFYRDTLIEVDTGFVRPIDSIAVPNRMVELEGDVTFESDTMQSALVYVKPYYTDLSIVPSTNYLVGSVKRGHNVLSFHLQDLIQRGYPRGVPVDVALTTRMNNTYYFEPETRLRVVTDPHDLVHVVMVLPVE